MNIQQNTLYLVTPGSYVSRDHLTLRVEVEKTVKLSIPIHHLESICVFGPSTVSAPALSLCWEHGVAVNFLSEWGKFLARMTGVADTSVTLRRTQFRAADIPAKCAGIARQIVAGKIQNSRNSLLRGGRENEDALEREALQNAVDAMARHLRLLERAGACEAVAIPEPERTLCGEWEGERPREPSQVAEPEEGFIPGNDGAPERPVDVIRGMEGMASHVYFSVFTLLLKKQRDAFAFVTRTRRPPRDRINCLLSFLYALVRHDCVAALTSAGLDPFVGFLHVDRPNRPSLALDLMEEFRPWLADRLAITLVNRQQIGPDDFVEREGGVVEFSEKGRKIVIKAYQERKQEKMQHPVLNQNLSIAQLYFIQARILARTLRGDLAAYVPFIPK